MIGHLDTFDKVFDGLFIGNSSAAKNLSLLKVYGITHILICCKEVDPIFPNEFIYKKLDITDSIEFNIMDYFEEANEFVEQAIEIAKGNVYIHCVMGQSRSATIAIAYIMKKRGFSAIKALDLMKKKHRDTHPNVGFITQLSKYGRNLKENGNEPKINSICTNCIIF